MKPAGGAEFAAVDALAADHQRRGGQPGVAYGVVAGGRLVHAGGTGERWLDGPPPDAGTVFRIASMTKSFTAAAVLALRDEGALALDDPVADYVGELRGLRPPAADAPPVTLRHLLTMTAGFPTDDPWGDRQQGLPLADFARLLAGGVSFAWAPGTRFEYSNLGYAILGRVIAVVSGQAYPDFVSGRLLRPLGMSRTVFEAAQVPAADLATGYRHGAGGWEALAPDPYGAFASMGGVFSCVADLARWVSGLAAAFPAGAPGDGGPHPLRRAARREMQSAQVMLTPAGPVRVPGDPAGDGPAGYGFGLFTDHDPGLGRFAGHSGGYPGFGSHMRWHLASGTGVIVLANSTYAAVRPLASRMLAAVLAAPAEGEASPAEAGSVSLALAPAPGGPWPATLAARREVTRLLRSWDDSTARSLFAPNVELDEPLPQRRRTIALLRERIGDFRDDPARLPEFDSPAHCRWWLRGERGVAAVAIQLTPEASPRVQSLTLALPPAPGSPLARAAASLVALLNAGAPGWPPTVPAAASVDTGVLARRLAMAAAWAGRCRPGAARAGNGTTTVTMEIDGEHARIVLALAVDAAGILQHADVAL